MKIDIAKIATTVSGGWSKLMAGGAGYIMAAALMGGLYIKGRVDGWDRHETYVAAQEAKTIPIAQEAAIKTEDAKDEYETKTTATDAALQSRDVARERVEIRTGLSAKDIADSYQRGFDAAVANGNFCLTDPRHLTPRMQQDARRRYEQVFGSGSGTGQTAEP